MGDVAFSLAGEAITLLPERALYWRRAHTLLIADAHWGKAATLRAAGVPLPGEPVHDDLVRLTGAIERTGARRVIFLGDLFHARAGRSADAIAAVSAWRAAHAALALLLIRGNHDQHAGDPPDAWGVTCADAPVLEPPFAFVHHPTPVPDSYALAGHLHPAMPLRGKARQQLRLPCFWFGERLGVLPAFGSLTGNATITPAPSDRVFVVAGESVLAVR